MIWQSIRRGLAGLGVALLIIFAFDFLHHHFRAGFFGLLFWPLWMMLALSTGLTGWWGSAGSRSASEGAWRGAMTLAVPASLVGSWVTYVAYFMPIQNGISLVGALGYGLIISGPSLALGSLGGTFRGSRGAKKSF